MASFDPPETPARADAPATTGIQAPAETPSIPLAPLPRPPAVSVEQFTRFRGWLDALLVVLVLVFAFLIASFPATNPDFFRQAATGRLIAEGAYSFGTDPFSFAGDEVYCVNHSWLFGLLVYALYQIPTIGGTVVVIFKALLVVVLAEILLRIGRRVGQSLWIPATCTALAVLAISPRLYLQSTCLSFLFLGLTLWLLSAFCCPPSALRQQEMDGGQRTADSGWRIWLLPLLFALWANCDQWFFLGPLAVALYLAGELIQQWLSPGDEGPDKEARRQGVKTLGFVLLVGLAACLINPHHVHVFTLPPELGLSPANDLIDRDAQFRTLLLSPLRSNYYELYFGWSGWSVAGMSYWPLLLLGLVSFGFVFGRAPWWRLSVWLGFALLSLYNAHCIPFFAIVAGPITALNWLDVAAHHLGGVPRLTTGWRWWSLGGRALTSVLALVLLAATVPGWLHAQPFDQHRVGWGVTIDPSLEQAAKQIARWRNEGKLPSEPHWFNMHKEVANYLAWFAPGERVFLDQQLLYFPKAADEYLTLREGLEQIVSQGNNPENGSLARSPDVLKKQWEKILRDRHVRFWIFYEDQQMANSVARFALFSNSAEWVLCSMHGRIAIFAWRDPEAKDEPDPSRELELDLKSLAFGPEAEQAPPQGPEIEVPRRDLWNLWLHPAPRTSAARWQAALYEYRFKVLEWQRQQFEVYKNSCDWQAMVAAGAVGASLPWGPVPNSLLPLSWNCTYHDLFPPGRFQPVRPVEPREQEALKAWVLYVNSRETDLPPSLYLAVRAGRRGLLDNPQDPQTYLLLGQTYAWLDGQPHERALKTAVPLSDEIRRTQRAAAFQNCLRFRPSPALAAEAHAALFRLFDKLPYKDVTANHLREWINNLRAVGPGRNVSATQHAQTLDKMAQELKRREEKIETEKRNYILEANKKPALEKVLLALRKGLAETALTALKQAPSGELIGPNGVGVRREVREMLLNLGRLDEARDSLIPEGEEVTDKPMSPEFLDLHLRLAAGRGDYEWADRILADALNYAWKNPAGQPMHFGQRNHVGDAVRQVLMGELRAEAQHLLGIPQPLVPPWLPSSEYARRRWRLEAIQTGLLVEQQRAEWYMLRGWLAVESGRCVEAPNYFQAALDTLVPPPRWMPEVNKLNILLDTEARSLQELGARQGIAWSLARQYMKWLKASQR
ncbi:MAG TPA: hypothetical protein VH682_11245 [Gemmataceae bacterium]|jgi:hypothetical protein